MARMKDINDLFYTDSGDFWLGENGDLEDTRLDHYRGLIQRVHTRVGSSKGDWDTQREVGAGLTDFLGKQNSSFTADNIKRRVYSELLQDDLLRPSEFVVDVLPISDSEVAIAVIISPPRTTGRIVLMYSYSLADNKIHLRSA